MKAGDDSDDEEHGYVSARRSLFLLSRVGRGAGLTGRFRIRMAILIWLLLAFVPASHTAYSRLEAGEGHRTFLLELPELNVQVNENSTTVIPTSFLNHLRVQVLRSAQEVPPGKILVRVNGEPANIVMSTRTDAASVVCDLDLNFRPGFLLHAGQNVIEASAESIYGRPLYGVFVLSVRGEAESLRAIQRQTAVAHTGETPPQIHLIEPQGVVENVRELTVSGYVAGGAAPIGLTINGQALMLKASPANGVREVYLIGGDDRVCSFTAPVALRSAQSSIQIVATDAHGNSSTTIIPVVRGMRVPSQRWAVVIGVSHYQHSEIDLKFADRDAESIRDFLEDPRGGGVPTANMLFLENENATSTNIRDALFSFLSKPGPDDLVIWYFAGHGGNDSKSPDNYYLLGYDADIKNLGATAVRMHELQEAFSNYLKADLITLVDACHSGGVGKSVLNVTNVRWEKAGFGVHRAILTASDVGEFSQEDKKWGGGHGVFTYYVLQGLKGAGGKHPGQISVGDLFDYVRSQVGSETQGAQTPQALAGSERSLILTALKAVSSVRRERGLVSSLGGRP